MAEWKFKPGNVAVYLYHSTKSCTAQVVNFNNQLYCAGCASAPPEGVLTQAKLLDSYFITK